LIFKKNLRASPVFFYGINRLRQFCIATVNVLQNVRQSSGLLWQAGAYQNNNLSAFQASLLEK
jgi:hypothetical protein